MEAELFSLNFHKNSMNVTAFVNMVMNLQVPEKVGTLFSSSANITFSIRPLLHGLVNTIQSVSLQKDTPLLIALIY
jgi:hypothetical protein